MSTGTPMKDLKDCASEGTKQVPPDSSSDAVAMRTRSAQVPKSLPKPKIYPPLEYPPVDIDVENNNNNNNLFSPDLSCTHFFFVTAIAMPFYFN